MTVAVTVTPSSALPCPCKFLHQTQQCHGPGNHLGDGGHLPDQIFRNEELLREKATGIKCDRIAQEKYGKKTYFQEKNIIDARDHYRARYGLHAFAGNYSHDRQYAKTDWLCRCQQSSESESHLMGGLCKVYGDLNNDFGDLSENNNLVDFLKAVLDRRDFLEEQENCVSDTLGASSVPGLPGIRKRREKPCIRETSQPLKVLG